MPKPAPDYDRLVRTLQELEGREVEFHVRQAPLKPHMADGSYYGEPVFSVVSIRGQIRSVRRSSREDERWWLVFECVSEHDGYVSITVDRSGVEWIEFRSEKDVDFGQQNLIYSLLAD